MNMGLLLAALVTVSPLGAGDDFYGQNVVLLLNDPKVASVVGLTEEQKALVQEDLNDHLRLSVERSKLQTAKLKIRHVRDESERAKLEQEIATLEPAAAKFDQRSEDIQRTCAARLSPEPYQRLREVSWQLLGLDAFSLQRHTEKLGMTSADIAMAAPLRNEFTAKFLQGRDERRRLEPERSEVLKKLGVLEQELVAKIVSRLQPSTRATYEVFAGEPIGFTRWELRRQFTLKSD